MKKRSVCILSVLLLCLSLAACGAAPEQTVPGTEAAPETTAQAEPTETAETTAPSGHVYDNDCDEDCNECGQTRTVADHSYENACDGACDICGAKREVSDHEYDSDCDSKCNTCGTRREVSHGQRDEVGYCNECADYTGMTGDANYDSTVEWNGADTVYFRVLLGRSLKQGIRFVSDDTFEYTAYVDGYQQIELTDTPQAFPESEYLYLVITQKDGADSVVFQIIETP